MSAPVGKAAAPDSSGSRLVSAGAGLVLAALSGTAALMHQMIWVRRMVDILGADSGTFSRVVGAFFLGLSLGAFWAARRVTPRPWRSTAWAELAVAASAGLVIAACGFLQNWTPPEALVGPLRWIIPLLLILPPAFLMGMVIPWMIRALPSLAVPLYAINTLGGVAGIALVSWWVLPVLGLTGASVAALSLNLLVALGAWSLGGRGIRGDRAPRLGKPAGAHLAIAFASGFLVLGAEVALQVQFAQVLISSYFASSLILMMVLASLSLSAFLVPLLRRLRLPGALALGAVAFAIQPLLFIVQRAGLDYLPFEKPMPEYAASAIWLALPACALPMFFLGLVFPLVLRDAGRDGRELGWLLACNGLGGWLGAEVAARFLLPMFGLWWIMAVLAAGYGVCFLCLQRGPLRWIGATALLGVIAFGWRIDGRLPFAGLVAGDKLIKVGLGHEGVVGVVTGAPDDWRILFNNTYTLGGSRAQMNQERQTLLPVVLHGAARRVATLGVATGSSMAGALLDPGVEQVEGIELSPLVLRFARDYFGPFNRAIFENPRARFTYGDARWMICRRAGQYDVIEGDLFLPWRTGEGRLYAVEHFENVRRALRPGGLFCQWLPLYQLNREQFDTIVRTFREVFPEAWIIRGDFYTTMPILGLVGGRGLETIDWQGVESACARVAAANQSRDPLMRHAEGVAALVVGPASDPGPGPINTLSNSWIEWAAGRNVIGPAPGWFNGVGSANYLRAILRRHEGVLPAHLRSAQAYGDLCLAAEIAGTARLPQAPALQDRLLRELPPALREDPSADWSRWPMRFRPAFPGN